MFRVLITWLHAMLAVQGYSGGGTGYGVPKGKPGASYCYTVGMVRHCHLDDGGMQR